jgi:hypothetical protein
MNKRQISGQVKELKRHNDYLLKMIKKVQITVAMMHQTLIEGEALNHEMREECRYFDWL